MINYFNSSRVEYDKLKTNYKRMKRNTILIQIIAVLSILTTASCNKFLDITPKSKEVIRKIDHYKGLLYNTDLNRFKYAEGGAASSGHYTFFYMNDEITQDVLSYGNIQSPGRFLNAYQWASDLYKDDENYHNEWGSCYADIYIYNTIINGVSEAVNGTEKEKIEIEAEARVRRAHSYMLLVQTYSKPYDASTSNSDLGVPIILETNVAGKTPGRETLEKTYQFIINEMTQWVPLLPNNVYNRWLLSKAAGYFMLAKTYLHMSDYAKCLTALNLSKDNLADSDVEFYDYNIEFATDGSWGFDPTEPNTWISGYPAADINVKNKEWFFMYVYDIKYFMTSELTSSSYMRKECYDIYEASDLRKNFFSNKYYEKDKETGNYEYFNTLKDYKRINQLSMSYAGALPDLYLMLAECQARVGSLDKAKEYLLELRKNRMPLSDALVTIDDRNDLIRFIIDERSREFLLTGMRWFDMRRLWNDPVCKDKIYKYHSDGSNNKAFELTEKRLVYKIPTYVLKFNTNMKDNE